MSNFAKKDDCQFRHEHPHSKPPAKNDSKLDEENRALKKELFELQVQLDILMETQLNNEDRKKYIITNEIESFKNEFIHLLKEKNVIIDNQTRTIADITGKL